LTRKQQKYRKPMIPTPTRTRPDLDQRKKKTQGGEKGGDCRQPRAEKKKGNQTILSNVQRKEKKATEKSDLPALFPWRRFIAIPKKNAKKTRKRRLVEILKTLGGKTVAMITGATKRLKEKKRGGGK